MSGPDDRKAVQRAAEQPPRFKVFSFSLLVIVLTAAIAVYAALNGDVWLTLASALVCGLYVNGYATNHSYALLLWCVQEGDKRFYDALALVRDAQRHARDAIALTRNSRSK